ncbi:MULTISPECIES: lytic murein transglycosylase [Micromonospora]|uniref:Murein transglycosylase n=1 Tax=Micromonospora solifontis TaxID=2487138 RepID=A0ABX9WIK6_9ACTN|nr:MULTISPECIES: lytic murein transglycosylase [Micromonospora]NES12494.1 murein transglycosylase [Micromonospora sp. PPF5-17B]NES36061.1 murein transglycosylase [Micromonospora solifontis]NES54621.1 murein transglycosylase [Micromonospora sp. PPF5-6]RNL99982.1 murein transglycosylase [Micromonospora solifontis]
MVDGEERMTVRPLRPAAPPAGDPGHRPVPKPRRTASPEPATDADPKPPATDEPAEAKADGTVPAPDAAAVATPAAAGKAGPDALVESGAGVGSSNAPSDGTAGADAATGADPESPAPAGGRRRRIPFAHAVRVPPPRQLAVGAARATRDWSRRPSGRTTLPGLFLLVLVAATATAGALLVPAAIRKPEPVAVDASATAPAPGLTASGAVPGAPALTPPPLGGTGEPLGTLTPTPAGPVVGPVTGRPSDALAGWAQQVSQRTGIPVVALQAYGYTERVLEQTHRSCQLSWTTLAAIGYVESRHGSANGATLRPDGVSTPEIVGPPLNGQGGTSRIPDSDRGLLDHDTTWDHAIGPMQFIPGTWQSVGADGDNDGARNPHDLDDAALAAGNYLCQGGRNMSIPGDWWGAILSYNDVRRYAQDVFDKANEYGRLSRT